MCRIVTGKNIVKSADSVIIAISYESRPTALG